MIVIDASVLTEYLLERPVAFGAVTELVAGREHEPLHAPELVDPETLNALREMARRGAVTERRAGEAVRDLAKVRMLRYPHELLRARMWELRDRLGAYDAAYLALAELLGQVVLLTADRGLAAVGEQLLGPDRVTVAA